MVAPFWIFYLRCSVIWLAMEYCPGGCIYSDYIILTNNDAILVPMGACQLQQVLC